MPKYTPDQEGMMKLFSDKYMPEVVKEQTSAQDAMAKFQIMEQQLPTMTSTGVGAQFKQDLMSGAQMIAQTLGGNSQGLADKVAAGEIFGKYAKQTGMEMARLYDGSRVAVQEMQTAIQANPGFGVSKQGDYDLLHLMQNASKRVSDKGAWMQEYYRENQGNPAALNPAAAEAAFAKARPSLVYFSRAVPLRPATRADAAEGLKKWPPGTVFIMPGSGKRVQVPKPDGSTIDW